MKLPKFDAHEIALMMHGACAHKAAELRNCGLPKRARTWAGLARDYLEVAKREKGDGN